MIRPLEGFTVLDFSQFLAGPFASLRLADLGARVIKVERPGTGDAYRSNYGPALKIRGDNGAYYYVNRDKESVSVDLKDAAQREKLRPLLEQADAMIINFRPEVTKRLHLDYESVKAINPGIAYGQITGYGEDNAWKDKPGWCSAPQARATSTAAAQSRFLLALRWQTSSAVCIWLRA